MSSGKFKEEGEKKQVNDKEGEFSEIRILWELTHCFVFAIVIRCYVRKFHTIVMVVQWWKGNGKKSVMYVQRCCLAY